MITKEEIQALISQGIPGAQVEVRGDDGAHFEATVITADFAGLSAVKRQQMVYATLGDRITSGVIHALGLNTRTPDEA